VCGASMCHGRCIIICAIACVFRGCRLGNSCCHVFESIQQQLVWSTHPGTQPPNAAVLQSTCRTYSVGDLAQRAHCRTAAPTRRQA
jgi:hypothetical protein